MSDAFSIAADHRPPPDPEPRSVLITGAAGRIGSAFAEASHERYDLTLMDHPEADLQAVADYGHTVSAKLGDLAALREQFQGIDTIVHLAADPSPQAGWDSMLPNNITGTYHVMTAAVAAGCRRLVYASSIHAVSGYRKGYQVHTDDPVNPGDLYGVTKCFGEAMGRFIATQHGVSTLVVRIGAFQPREVADDPDSLSMMDAFVSHRDLVQLLQCCVDNEDLEFAILHGLSGNLFNRMEIQTACDLVGYEPQDDFTAHHPELSELGLRHQIMRHNEKADADSSLDDDLPPATS